jgi:type IV secretory pathway TrbF-like protein
MYLEGHDAEELFRNLSRRTKDSLRKFHNEYIKDAEGFEVAKRAGMKVDLDSLLEQGKNAFTEFRYAYEALPVDSAWGLGGLIFGVRARILKAHPEWQIRP